MLALPACSDDDPQGGNSTSGTSGSGTGGSTGEGGNNGEGGSTGEAGNNGEGGGTGEGGNDGEGGGGTDGFSFTGPITGDAVPEDAEVIVAWVVSSSSPDYAFRFGEGSVAGATFTVGVGADPPSEAINSYGVGVGVVMLLEPGTEVPEGELDEAVIEAAILGATPQHAIIWRDPSSQGPDWSDDFPDGFGCGRCVPADEGFDTFEPVECSEVEVQATSDFASLQFCNWT
ncbi:hypothetical protein [Sorangium sp. So ce1335]|uniref:hypothetical protein n=1 Tax=Sorangium sp. So ce1335 TaxID=3133335 RepID=UPI003F5D585E